MTTRKKMEKDDKAHKDQQHTTENQADIDTEKTAWEEFENPHADAEEPASDEDNKTGDPSYSARTDANDSKLMEKLSEMQDKYIRLSAEYDNYRKRTLREKMDLTKFAGENLLLKLLPFMDDFERALRHMDNSDNAGAVIEGINLIYLKFSDFLKQNGVKEIESLNQAFNVDIHEAVAKIEVEEEDKKGKVLDVVLKGYFLHDKVLRYSKVVVGE